VLPPYPIDIVPLIPQFLQRRQARFDFPLRVTERLGIDRPALAFVITISAGPAEGSLPTQIGNAAYYTVLDSWRPQAAVAEAAGLASEDATGRWTLTQRGDDLVRELRAALRAHYASLQPVPVADLRRLADMLERAFQSTALTLRQDRDSHVPRVARLRGIPPDSPFGELEAAMYALWMARDDAHLAAWRAAGIDGPALDALTRIWRDEAPTAAELAAKLTQQRPDDVDAAIGRLRTRGWVGPAEPLRATESGRSARQAIEDETDRLFFSPWPEEVGREAPWMRERLQAVNQALA
jgi:hypothetical protein